MATDGDWPDLPPELLRVISSDLDNIPDYLRFRAVCSSWRVASPLTMRHLPREFPWLMLPITTSNRTEFFNPITKILHKINLPESSRSRRRAGSSFGWLILIEESPSIFLINPITRAVITLPPLSSFPNVSKFDIYSVGREYTLQSPGNGTYCCSLKEMRDSFIKKVILSNSPGNESDFAAFAILNRFGDLAYCRKGDDSWRIIDEARWYCEDVIYFAGSFYAVNKYGSIVICDVSDGDSSPKISFIITPQPIEGDVQYLVDGMGEILLVTRYLDSEIDMEYYYEVCRTVKFDVFRLDFVERRWVRVPNLNDKVLFLGDNSSFALSAGQRNSYGKRSHSQTRYSDDSGSKRRNIGSDKDTLNIGSNDTVYRYLCPSKKIGSIMGKGGEIIKQLSASEETNDFEGIDICPAHDALLKVHDRVADDDTSIEEKSEEARKVTVRLLVPSDQIGGVIGKGGQTVQSIRSETGATIRIIKDGHVPTCALGSDELVQISGDASTVKKALHQIAKRLHDNPTRSQHLISTAAARLGPTSGAPVMPLVSTYGGYRAANIGGVIGKGGSVINQIRQDSGAVIKVDSSTAEGEDRVISISAKEAFDDTYSPAIDAAVRLQPRCSEQVERDSGLVSFTTRLLVSKSLIGCLIGKGGYIISDMRRITKASIRILSKENLPKVAAEDDEMVMISGDLDTAKDALVQVTSRLRANLFENMSPFPHVLPYVAMSPDGRETRKYETRDFKHRGGRGYSRYSGGYGGSADVAPVDKHDRYDSHQSGNSAPYGSYSSGRSGGSRLSGRTRSPGSRGRNYDY